MEFNLLSFLHYLLSFWCCLRWCPAPIYFHWSIFIFTLYYSYQFDFPKIFYLWKFIFIKILAFIIIFPMGFILWLNFFLNLELNRFFLYQMNFSIFSLLVIHGKEWKESLISNFLRLHFHIFKETLNLF